MSFTQCVKRKEDQGDDVVRELLEWERGGRQFFFAGRVCNALRMNVRVYAC